MPKLQHPTSENTVVDVSAERAKVLRNRGYTDVAGEDKPNQSDTKGDWVDYAKTHGYDPDEALTKDDLIERYG